MTITDPKRKPQWNIAVPWDEFDELQQYLNKSKTETRSKIIREAVKDWLLKRADFPIYNDEG